MWRGSGVCVCVCVCVFSDMVWRGVVWSGLISCNGKMGYPG
jgi:hypothetical protein